MDSPISVLPSANVQTTLAIVPATKYAGFKSSCVNSAIRGDSGKIENGDTSPGVAEASTEVDEP